MEKIALVKSKSSSERYYLIKDGQGMGGAGNPKGHYAHAWVVVNGIDRGNGYQGYMSVDYAISDDVTWLPMSAKNLIREKLNIKS